MRTLGGDHAGNPTTLVVFESGGVRCALRREAVSQIIAVPSLFRPPNLPSPVVGFVNRAGQTIPVLRAALLLGRSEIANSPDDDLYRHVVFLRSTNGEFGILVDHVVDVLRIDAANLRPSGPADTLNGVVEGVIEAVPLVHLLTPSRMLLNGERLRLADLVAAEQARLEAWAV